MACDRREAVTVDAATDVIEVSEPAPPSADRHAARTQPNTSRALTDGQFVSLMRHT